MWCARDKELELESKMKGRSCRSKDHDDFRGEKRKSDLRNHSSSSRVEQEGATYCNNSYLDQDDGLGDDEVERFLHSRAKRGRGAVGSRMDEPGPYLDSFSRHQDNGPSPDIRVEEKWERRVQGPEKPSFLGSKSLDGHWRKGALDRRRPSSSEPQTKKEKKNKSEKRDKIGKKKENDKKKSKRRHRPHRSSRSQ